MGRALAAQPVARVGWPAAQPAFSAKQGLGIQLLVINLYICSALGARHLPGFSWKAGFFIF